MLPDKSCRDRRPRLVTVAFWLQLVVAGLIVVLTVFNAVVPYWLRAGSGESFLGAPAVAEAAWLAFSAVGLRRGARAAWWMSLAGLTAPLVALVIGALGTPIHNTLSLYVGQGGTERIALWALLSVLVNGTLAPLTPVLDVAALTLLVTRPARRFFGRPTK
jgi:hypothetical protein